MNNNNTMLIVFYIKYLFIYLLLGNKIPYRANDAWSRSTREHKRSRPITTYDIFNYSAASQPASNNTNSSNYR